MQHIPQVWTHDIDSATSASGAALDWLREPEASGTYEVCADLAFQLL